MSYFNFISKCQSLEEKRDIYFKLQLLLHKKLKLKWNYKGFLSSNNKKGGKYNLEETAVSAFIF